MKNRIDLDRFLFTQIHTGNVAIMRIALGILLMVSFWNKHEIPSPNFYLRKFDWIYYWYEAVFLKDFYFMLIYFLLGLFVIGLLFRAGTFLLVFLLIPLVPVGFGTVSAQVFIICLICLSLTPYNVKLSLANIKYLPGSRIKYGPVWPIRLIQTQLTCLYGYNAIGKSHTDFLSGRVLENYSEHSTQFIQHFTDGIAYFGPFMISSQWAAISVVSIEYLLAIGFWIPGMRWVVAIMGVLFHWIMAHFIEVYLLHWAGMFMYLSFLLDFEGDDLESMVKATWS